MPGLIVKSCCFSSVSLKKGCYIIAVIDLICSVTLISVELFLLHNQDDKKLANRYNIILILLMLVYIVNDINLVIGAYLRIRCLLLSWVILRTALALLDCLLITYIDMKMPNSLHKDHSDTFPHPMCGFLLTILYMGIIVYEVLVVISYYKFIKLDQEMYYTPTMNMDPMNDVYSSPLSQVPSAPPLSPLFQQPDYRWYQPAFNSLRRG